jgi:hypothetical protein
MMGLKDGSINESDQMFLMVYIGRLGPEKRLKDLRLILGQLTETLFSNGDDY